MGCLGEIQDKAGNRLRTPSALSARHWINECDAPLLSIGTPKTPDSDVLRIRNDSTPESAWAYMASQVGIPERAVSTTASSTFCADQCSECRSTPGQPHNSECDVSCSPDISCDRKDDATGCDEAAQLMDAHSYAVETHPEPPKCPCCLQETENDEGILCELCEEPTGPGSFAVVNGPGGVFVYHLRCYDEVYWGDEDASDGSGHNYGQEADAAVETHEDLQGKDADSFVVTSCPDCGAATDIGYGTVKDKPPDCQAYSAREWAALMTEGYREVAGDTEPELLTSTVNPPGDVVTVRNDNLSVPFRVQSWMFESLCEVEIENLHDLIDDHHTRIVEMARDRFRKGYAKYGSTMYSWSPERRLDETLQELADATVYPTSGPLE